MDPDESIFKAKLKDPGSGFRWVFRIRRDSYNKDTADGSRFAGPSPCPTLDLLMDLNGITTIRGKNPDDSWNDGSWTTIRGKSHVVSWKDYWGTTMRENT